ncbi:unnamed protein product, partial [Staurois parvus]
MYTHAQRHVHTYRHVCTYTEIHTYRHMYIHMYTHRHVYRYTHVHTHRHVQLYMHTQTHTNTHTSTHTHHHLPPIKSCSTSLFTHRAGYCTLGGGREHSTHSLLCFHCAQLLSSLTAPSANDRSGLSSEPAHQDGPGGHTRPHYNFHSPLASRNFKPCNILY